MMLSFHVTKKMKVGLFSFCFLFSHVVFGELTVDDIIQVAKNWEPEKVELFNGQFSSNEIVNLECLWIEIGKKNLSLSDCITDVTSNNIDNFSETMGMLKYYSDSDNKKNKDIGRRIAKAMKYAFNDDSMKNVKKGVESVLKSINRSAEHHEFFKQKTRNKCVMPSALSYEGWRNQITMENRCAKKGKVGSYFTFGSIESSGKRYQGVVCDKNEKPVPIIKIGSCNIKSTDLQDDKLSGNDFRNQFSNISDEILLQRDITSVCVILPDDQNDILNRVGCTLSVKAISFEDHNSEDGVYHNPETNEIAIDFFSVVNGYKKTGSYIVRNSKQDERNRYTMLSAPPIDGKKGSLFFLKTAPFPVDPALLTGKKLFNNKNNCVLFALRTAIGNAEVYCFEDSNRVELDTGGGIGFTTVACDYSEDVPDGGLSGVMATSKPVFRTVRGDWRSQSYAYSPLSAVRIYAIHEKALSNLAKRGEAREVNRDEYASVCEQFLKTIEGVDE